MGAARGGRQLRMYNIADPDVPVLIVGAGPTGLTLGYDLARRG